MKGDGWLKGLEESADMLWICRNRLSSFPLETRDWDWPGRDDRDRDFRDRDHDRREDTPVLVRVLLGERSQHRRIGGEMSGIRGMIETEMARS